MCLSEGRCWGLGRGTYKNPHLWSLSNTESIRGQWLQYVFAVFAQLLSHVQLCNPRDCSPLGIPVLHYLLDFARIHDHWVADAIQSSHLRPLPSFFVFNLPASGSFPMSQFFPSGGKSIGASASASLLPMNIQDWFPLGLTALISLQFRGLLKVFSDTTVQKHQFFGAYPLLSHSHIHTWLLEKP